MQNKKSTLIKHLVAAIGLAFAGLAQAAPEYVAIGPNGENLQVVSLSGHSVAISANGSKVFFYGATTVAPGSGQQATYQLLGRNRQTQTTTKLDSTIDGSVTGLDSSLMIGGVSGDGRSLLFSSSNAKLVPNDTNQSVDLFLSDLQTGRITRVNVTDNGVESDPSAIVGSQISTDGRYVVFLSKARNLLQGSPTNGGEPYFTFVRDLQAGTTKVLNPYLPGSNAPKATAFGILAPEISADGRFVAFRAYAEQANVGGYFIADQLAGTYTALPADAWPAGYWAMSANGRYIAMGTDVDASTTGIKVYDAQSRSVELVTDASTQPSLTPSLSISANGRYITYVTKNDKVLVLDRQTRQKADLSNYGVPPHNGMNNVAISSDGRHIMVKERALANPLFAEDGFCSIYNPYISE